MKILFAASEASPFVKVGGLGDVIGSLPKSLKKKCDDVRVVIPYYSSIGKGRDDIKFVKYYYIDLAFKRHYVGLFETEYEGIKYYLIDNEEYFNRPKTYGEIDDGKRFAFFSKAVIDLLPEINFKADIINANDWHTSLVPAYLNMYKKNQVDFYKDMKSVISIHNIEFQGKFDMDYLGQVFGFDESYKNIFEYDSCLNLLKAGIQTADLVTTVSETYANEILDPYFSYGLDSILRNESYKVHGIVNGIDIDLFNPNKDPYIYVNYTSQKLNRKKENKLAFQQEMALKVDVDKPMVGMVTRLTHQKGIDLILGVIDELVSRDIQLVILGTGDKKYEDHLRDIEGKYHDKVRSIIKFSNELAQKIYASSDIFLMPSKAEPCGLSQMIAMRYGSVPVVHSIGGLNDTVRPYNRESNEGLGFTFQSFNAHDMLYALDRALESYNDKKQWNNIVKNSMKEDFSWEKSADKYIKLYKGLLIN